MATLKQALLALRSGGLWQSLGILRYTRYKSRLDRNQTLPSTPIHIPPGRLYKLDIHDRICTLRFEHAQLDITYLAPDIACLEWSPGPPIPSYAIDNTRWPPTAVQINREGGDVSLSSEHLRILVGEQGETYFYDTNGVLLRNDQPPTRRGSGWSVDLNFQPNAVLLGLGVHSGPFNLLRRQHLFWNRDPGGSYRPGADPLYMPIPVFLALQDQGSFMAFFENSARGLFAPYSSTSPHVSGVNLSFENGRLRQYFIPGPPPRAMERFTELTGRAPLPPLWSLGYHQSRWGYRSEAELRRVVEGFHQHDLPIRAIHLDLDYLDRGRVFAFDPHRFPDPAGLSNWLAQAGIHLVTILDPGIKDDPKFDLHIQGLEENHFCQLPDGEPVRGMLWIGPCHYPDFTHPDTRRWWGDQYSRLLDVGVSGFWHDMNEPVSFTAWGDLDLPSATRYHLEGLGGDHTFSRNLYGLQMNRSGFEALKRIHPERRPWILSRSGWAGSQRYAWNWTADTECTWECLRMNLASILSLGLSGFAYTGPDIGGFDGDPPAELYLRWFQMAAFLPFFRTHSATGTARREPWVFGEPYTTIIRRFLYLRQELMPYLYSLAWEHTQTGAPWARPLFWDKPSEPELWEVDDAFLLGAALLVAPVMEPGATSRSLMLPEGEWYDFWDGRCLSSPNSRHIRLPITLEHIPILVRAGSLVPRQERETLLLSLYPHASPTIPEKICESSLYSDDGEGYGPHRLDRFVLREKPEEITLEWLDEGDYPLPYQHIALQLPAGVSARLWVDGKATLFSEGRAVTGRFSQIKLTELHIIA